MVFDFKDKKVSNSLSVFNYYKGLTGRSLESDIRKMKKLEEIKNNPTSTEAEIEAVQEAMPLDILEIVQYIYYSMRCAAEKKELDLSEVINEVDVSDLADGSLQQAIMTLVDVKKKEVAQLEKRKFLLLRRR